MSQYLNDNFNAVMPKHIDDRYFNPTTNTPWASVAEANAGIPSFKRVPYLPVRIGTVEHEYKGGILNSDLKPKTAETIEEEGIKIVIITWAYTGAVVPNESTIVDYINSLPAFTIKKNELYRIRVGALSEAPVFATTIKKYDFVGVGAGVYGNAVGARQLTDDSLDLIYEVQAPSSSGLIPDGEGGFYTLSIVDGGRLVTTKVI